MNAPFEFKRPKAWLRYCYLNAFEVARANPGQPWRIVHGIVCPDTGEAAGREAAHAWCEIENAGRRYVYDPSLGGGWLTTANVYRTAMNVLHSVEYTLAEATALNESERHIGPWDESVSGGIHARRARGGLAFK